MEKVRGNLVQGQQVEGWTRRDFLQRSAAGLAGAIVGGTFLAACDDNVSNDENGGEARQSISTDITSGNYPITIGSVPYLVGMSEGTFEKYGWNVGEVVGSSGGGTTVRNVVLGDLPVGEVATAAVIQAWINGAPIVPITGAVNSISDDVWVTRPDLKHDSPEDMAGRRVGYTNPAGGAHIIMALVLDQVGLTDEVELVATGGVGEGLALLDAGDIDYAIHILPLYYASQDKYKIAFNAGEIVPSLTQTCIVVGRDFFERDKDLIERFLDARAETLELITSDIPLAAEAWAAALEGTEVSAAQETLETVDPSKAYQVRAYDSAGIQASLKGMGLVGLIDPEDPPSLEAIFDQSFIPESDRVSL